MISGILLVIITIFLPPVGVYLIAGCGADLLINILLTCLGYFPGHIHAFYLEYVYYKKRDEIAAGRGGMGDGGRQPGGVYSQNVLNGGYGGQAPAAGYGQGGAYGTMGGGPAH
ncbi:hypothetical protein B0A55_03558 [Friedmanniomyces simplex]|uniref:Plasma membrane proteolipid 3 n=1 Tax=Friedmanniomyces simplex TaxID=329884 RepID=A0A4V5NKP4_9PEZI|nr:hypothetical protein B0A55_03558 [Friedmanniomyces simplex]